VNQIAGIVGLAVVIASAIALITLTLVHGKRPQRGLRAIATFSRLRQAIGLAVEDGSRLHVSLGKANLTTAQNASALVGLSVLDRVAQLSSASDRPPVATSGDGGLAILSQDTLRGAYRSANAVDLYDPRRGMLTGITPFSYIAGTLPVMRDENISANILIGNFGPEVALLTGAAEQQNSFTLAASDSLPAQAVLYATASETLIGEELFAAGAYVAAGGMHNASLRVQDMLRWVVIAVMLAGSILKLIGVI
jgi:hypothetical protein